MGHGRDHGRQTHRDTTGPGPRDDRRTGDVPASHHVTPTQTCEHLRLSIHLDSTVY